MNTSPNDLSIIQGQFYGSGHEGYYDWGFYNDVSDITLSGNYDGACFLESGFNSSDFKVSFK